MSKTFHNGERKVMKKRGIAAARARKFEERTLAIMSFEKSFEGTIVGDAYDNRKPVTRAGVLSSRKHR